MVLNTMDPYSTKNISKTLLQELSEALQTVKSYGSVEIYVQNNKVTQITVRNIHKTGINNNGKSTKQKLKQGKKLVGVYKGIDK